MLEDNVLITGGAGFLGRGIMREANRQGWPANFIVYSRGEQMQAECRRKFPNARYVLGDVRDTERLALVMTNVKYVIHAAAMKFIPEAEANASECVGVNIDGARSVISAARASGVFRVVGISTDKAAAPVNVYGMTKAVMERLFADANVYARTPIFTTCRYGNVIGSTGSVVPVMIDQYRKEGYVNVTELDMTRYWMNVTSAVNTILAALEAPGGVTVVPSPSASTMDDLSYAVLDYLNAGERTRHIVGRRPGEKLHEDLISPYELSRTELLPDYMYIHPSGTPPRGREVYNVTSDVAHKVDRATLVEWIKDSVTV